MTTEQKIVKTFFISSLVFISGGIMTLFFSTAAAPHDQGIYLIWSMGATGFGMLLLLIYLLLKAVIK